MNATPLLFAALLATGCDPVFSICVTVVTCEGRDPVVGARVVLPDFEEEMFTEPSGRACYGNVGELRDPFTIDVDKPNFEPKSTTVDPPDGPGRFDTTVCLEAVGEGG
jgi:hypothetical protein